jgi:hypothetical protein
MVLGPSSPNVPANFVFLLFLLDGYPTNLCGFSKFLDRLLSPDALAPPLTVVHSWRLHRQWEHIGFARNYCC